MTLDEAKAALQKAQQQYNQAVAVQAQLREVIPFLNGVVQALENPDQIKITNAPE